MDNTLIVTITFGFAYLVIGLFHFRGLKMILYFGVIIPLIGMLLVIEGRLANPASWRTFFIIIDTIVIPCFIYLTFKDRNTQRM